MRPSPRWKERGRVSRAPRRVIVLSVLSVLFLVTAEVAGQPTRSAEPIPEPTVGCRGGTLGPIFDPIAGDRIGEAELACLPSGRHLGAVFDVLFNRVTTQHISDGGIAFFDPVRISAHGRSWRQTRFHLNGIEITDPARPGEPLVELPSSAWDGLAYRSLWTGRPGVDLTFHADPSDRWRVTGATGGSVGGGTWVPRGLFDRDPATEHGAIDERRQLRPRGELFVQHAWQHERTGRVRLLASLVEHEHRYPTLRSNDAETGIDRSRRGSFALRHEVETDDGRSIFSTTVIAQADDRSHDGAQYRWEPDLTLDRSSRAWGAYLQWARPRSDLVLAVGVTGRRDEERSRRATPFVGDLESAWLYLARPRAAEDLRRWRLDGSLTWRWNAWRLDARGTYARIDLTTLRPSLTGTSYLRGGDRGQPVAVSLEVASPVGHELSSRAARLDIGRDVAIGPATMSVMAALDHSAVGAGSDRTLRYLSPAAGAAIRAPCGSVECFALVRHEPIILTRDVSEFLSPTGSWTTNVWNDDGDLIPHASEAGPVLARHGGMFHAVGDNLARPRSNHVAFGVRTSRPGPLGAGVAAVARWLSSRYTVRLSDPSVYSPVEVETADGYPMTAFTRDVSAAGQETYVLVNDPRASRYLGFEAQVQTQDTRRWFLHLSASGYQFFTNAPFGSFADRNDPGAIDEITADPNTRVNGWGRSDNDRAYAATLLLGREMAPDLWLSTATRYLDGQPFARIDVVETLAQGPTAVMTTPRGTPGPRHTFHMTTDVRLAYLLRGSGPSTVSLGLDVFNLLDSRTEIAEDPRAGPEYRRALEMIPGRALMATVEWRHRP